MDHKNGYEAELLFIIPDDKTYNYIKNSIAPSVFKIVETNSYLQGSIFYDNYNLDFFKNNSSLAYQLLPNDNELYLTFKNDSFYLLETKMLVRTEIGITVMMKSNDYPEILKKKITNYINDINLNGLYPKIIVKQQRTHYIIENSKPTIHLSLDKVKCTNPNDLSENLAFYSVEIEITNNCLRELSNKNINVLRQYFRSFGCSEQHPSKYRYILRKFKMKEELN